ncbi:MAG: helix-turn-helix domain-containing protein [Clostridiaceae bacterium]|nr:helix-turn-helix domain-containing protein [Clostridiaceae bacterium]
MNFSSFFTKEFVMVLIEETKRLHISGVKQKEISKILGISKKTIYRYLRRTEPTYSSSKNRGSILDSYRNEIDQLFLKGTISKDILVHCRENGYIGCKSLIRMYLSNLKKLKTESNDKSIPSQRLIKREKNVQAISEKL